jgi:hypothetical protein
MLSQILGGEVEKAQGLQKLGAFPCHATVWGAEVGRPTKSGGGPIRYLLGKIRREGDRCVHGPAMVAE